MDGGDITHLIRLPREALKGQCAISSEGKSQFTTNVTFLQSVSADSSRFRINDILARYV